MTASVDTRLRGKTRWSLTARCPRMGAYALLGETPEDPSPEMQRWWRRGQKDEEWWVEEFLIPKYGREGLELQKAVEWGPGGTVIGELHPDAFVKAERQPYEIKSHAAGGLAEYDFVQLCGEMHFDPDAGDSGVLVVIDRDGAWEAIPVLLTPDRIDQVETLARQVADAGLTGELPERPCKKPADGRARLCPFVDTCFAGWIPPDVIELDGEIASIALEAYALGEVYAPLAAAAKEAEAAYKAAKARLSEFELQPGRIYRDPDGGITVKRTHVEATDKVSLKKLRESSVWTKADEVRFAPFVSPSGAHDRWKITVTEDAKSAIAATHAEDFGDEAPWDAEDLDGPVVF